MKAFLKYSIYFFGSNKIDFIESSFISTDFSVLMDSIERIYCQFVPKFITFFSVFNEKRRLFECNFVVTDLLSDRNDNVIVLTLRLANLVSLKIVFVFSLIMRL